MRRLATFLARWLVRLRFLVVGFWVAAAVAVSLLLPTIQQAQTGTLGGLAPSHGAAVKAELRSVRLFKFPLLSRTLVVERDPHRLPPAEQARVVARAVALDRHRDPGLTGVGGAIPVLNTLGKPPFSREPGTTAITYLFFPPDIGTAGQTGLAHRFLKRRVHPPPGTYTGVTGAFPARQEQIDRIRSALPIVGAATIALVLLVVGLHFRALLAPLVNLATVGLAYFLAVHALAGIAQTLHVSIPSEVEPVIVVLLFGVVTDYSVFFLSRFRALLAEGEPARRAAERATADLLPIVLTAGLTVVGASAALLVAQLSFFHAFGPGMALSVLIGLVVAMTFVPAVMAIGGLALYWPRRPGREIDRSEAAEETPDEERGRPWRTRVLRTATAHPLPTALVCLAILLAAASGLGRLAVGETVVRALPPGAEAQRAYVQAKKGFAPGILAPTVPIVEAPGITGRRTALGRLQMLMGRQPGVAAVFGPAQSPTHSAIGAALSTTGKAARFFVVFDADPLGHRAIARLAGLEQRMPALLRTAGLGGARASYAGDTAIAAETLTKTAGDLRRIAPVALGVVFLALAIFLRALVAPLYLVAASVLSLAASLGVTVYVFQGLLGYGDLTFYIPFAAAVLLVALGSDYNVFLVGRIWQEAGERPLRDAVAVAGARAAGAITTAGVALAFSFALLAIVPLRPFRELAFAMAVGILLDALLVRTLLVPALIVLVGRRSGWPGRQLARAGRRRGVSFGPAG